MLPRGSLFLPSHPSLSSGLVARSVPRGRCSFFLVFARVSLARARGLFSLPSLFSFLALFCLSCLSVCWQLDFKTTYIFPRKVRCRNSRFIRVWRAFGQVGTWECQKTKLLGSAAHAYLGSSTNCISSFYQLATRHRHCRVRLATAASQLCLSV